MDRYRFEISGRLVSDDGVDDLLVELAAQLRDRAALDADVLQEGHRFAVAFTVPAESTSTAAHRGHHMFHHAMRSADGAGQIGLVAEVATQTLIAD